MYGLSRDVSFNSHDVNEINCDMKYGWLVMIIGKHWTRPFILHDIAR